MLPSVDFLIPLVAQLMQLLHLLRLALQRNQLQTLLAIPPIPDMSYIMNLIMYFLQLCRTRTQKKKIQSKCHNLIKLLRNYR